MTAADSAARDSAAHRAQANYVRVINSNNTDSLASMLTDDVIFLAANEKPIVGKAAVRAWVVPNDYCSYQRSAIDCALPRTLI